MAFTWSKDKIRFFKDASAYTGFHRKLADLIKPYLKNDQSLCDIGCGLGLLDFQISPYVKNIDAIDINEDVIDDYHRRLRTSSISNIHLQLADADTLSGKKWDVVLLSLFGKPGEDTDHLFSLAEDRIIIITYVERRKGETADNATRPTTAAYEEYIRSKGYRYEKIVKTMDFGQPFRSMEDAKEYFISYMINDSEDDKQTDVNDALKDVITVDNEEFPYFLKKEKDVGIFIVEA